MRFDISFNSFNAKFFATLGMGPKRSFVEVTDATIAVRLGPSFAASIPHKMRL